MHVVITHYFYHYAYIHVGVDYWQHKMEQFRVARREAGLKLINTPIPYPVTNEDFEDPHEKEQRVKQEKEEYEKKRSENRLLKAAAAEEARLRKLEDPYANM